MNATFNVVAVTDVLQANFVPAYSWWAGRWASIALSSMMLLPLALIAYKGAGSFAKINAVIFLGLAIACCVTAGSLFFRHEEVQLMGGPGRSYRPFNLETLAGNMWPEPVVSTQCESSAAFGMGKKTDQICTPQLIFSVIFPAVVGMMEGLNLSGDLKRPGRSIPVGTFWAVGVAFLVYATLMVGQAGTLSREALQYNMDVLQKSTVAGGSFVVLGVVTACLSTVLGSLFGAARVLQALARDEVFPGLACFKYGTPGGDEPRPAILVSYLLAQVSLFLGNLDDLAPLLTNFFLLTYAFTDLACFLLEISRVPNFRPTFRFYSWQTSLANSLLTVSVMFYLSPAYAGSTLIVTFFMLVCLTHRFRDRPEWIDVSQALFFGWARDSLLALQLKPQDMKYWRPSLLLLVPSTADASTPGFLQLVAFLNRLKQSGLFVIGRALISEHPPTATPLARNQSPGTSDGLHTSGNCQELEEQLQQQLAAAMPDFKGFQQWAVAPSGRLASYNLMLGAGLGRLLPDTVVLPLPQPREPSEGGLGGLEPLSGVAGAREFVQVIRDVLSLRRNVLVTANFHALPDDAKGADLSVQSLDMWVLGDLDEPPLPQGVLPAGTKLPAASAEMVNQMSLLLQLGHLAGYRKSGGMSRLRLLQAKCGPHECSSEEQLALADDGTSRLGRWLQWSRMPRASAEVVLLKAPPCSPSAAGAQALNSDDWLRGNWQLLRELFCCRSGSSEVILTLLPPPPAGSSDDISEQEYLQNLRDMTVGLPPTMLVLSGQGTPVISTEV
ncbi:unnamed protein product [Polarella glacialis]|uniref:Amino acid permease/ SLC12A domain-containing protein n=1 Tax=Polarella glacialis TaxID=89957 RepID=A0A813E7L9_POLGL|nr:unnamed protein product [Polarella glacialis]